MSSSPRAASDRFLTLAAPERPDWKGRASRATSAATARRVAYFVNEFPYPTETFVYREVLALRERGFEILPFSLRTADADAVSEEARPLIADTWSIQPAPLGELVAAHLRCLLGSPRTYLETLIAVLLGTHDRARDRLRSLAHFVQAVSVVPALRRLDVDHLHAHFAVGSATCAWVVSRFLDLPWSFTAHAYDIWLDKLLLPEKLAAARFVLTCTEANRRHLIDTYGAPAEAIHTVHHGIDIERFQPAAKAPSGEGPPRILCVGRLVEQKGIAILLEACGRLAERGCDFELWLAGDGPLRASLEAQARALGITERVVFAGHVFQEKLLDLYASADLFALPCVPAANQDRDGIPNTLIEAMACALPVVSTDFSGVPELVEHGQNGLLVPTGDVEALASALERLLRDEALRAELSSAARETIVRDFSIEASTEALLRVTGWGRGAEDASP